jgi:hypothetical protein
LLVYLFNDVFLFFCTSILFLNLWQTYFLFINNITTPKIGFNDTNKNKIVNVLPNQSSVIYGLIFSWIFLLNYFLIQKFNITNVFWDLIYLSNNTVFYGTYLTMILLLIIIGVQTTIRQNIVFSPEYLIFLVLLIFFGYIVVSSSSLFLTIFSLEIVALIIFGKFSVSKILHKNGSNYGDKKNPSMLNQVSYGLLNSLFFQFWANFVSSIFLFYSLINIHNIFGLSNFFLSNFLLSELTTSFYLPEVNCYTILILFITGLFIKLGISPYQFFKIETYKGIPLFFVVVYTSVYLMIYVYFFVVLYLYLLPILKHFTNYYLYLIIFISLAYLFSLLFDTKNFKAFLSYSTLITVTSIFILILFV